MNEPQPMTRAELAAIEARIARANDPRDFPLRPGMELLLQHDAPRLAAQIRRMDEALRLAGENCSWCGASGQIGGTPCRDCTPYRAARLQGE